jgi:hypothetical protein
MICFEVTLNGKVVCTAGMADGILHWNLTSFGGNDGIRIDVGGTTSFERGDLAPKLQAALQRPEPSTAVHPVWLDERVKLGDEITVRIVDLPESDPPSKCQVLRPKSRRKA